ncbi:hypothetical protein MMC13_004250, partial [Lambiella insularis]|nr:hypothetical protein [Lambiella insularis]
GEEVLHLPVIVDAAESSPAAAKEAANLIRKFLSKDNFMRAYVQYNAIMLVRILVENPGQTFTRNLDGKFVVTTKELLRDGRDMSVQQILRETLDDFQLHKSQDETLQPLITMWQNEKAKMAKRAGGLNAVAPVPRPLNAPPFDPNQPYNSHQPFDPNQANYFARNHSRQRGLPPPHELASRIEEAKTSGKLLLQVVQSTPPNEILNNELIREFADRCQSASRSIQGYINSDNPAPDEDTLLTLIETNDQLSMAMSKHQRAVLQARKVTGQVTPEPPTVPARGPPPQNSYAFPLQGQNGPPPAPSLQPEEPKAVPPPGPPPRISVPKRQERLQNPFDDNNHTAAPSNPNGTSAPIPSIPREGPQPSGYTAYHPRYQATPNHVDRQELSTNNLAGADDEEVESPDVTRKPVQYRF